MENDEQTDEAFASEAFARLDPIEPSAALLRRVAEIPIIVGAPVVSPWWLAWNAWPARLLMAGALALGAVLGGMPWEGAVEETTSSESSADEAAGATEDDELESALSMALGSDWAALDAFAEESL